MSIKKCFERTPFFAGCPLAVRLKYSVSHRKGVHTQRQKKKEEEKGFDLLDAIYLEKGLVAAGSPHSMGMKAIGDARAHHEHHLEKEKGHRAAFTENVAVRTKLERAKFLETRHEKPKPEPVKLPLQMKKPDVEDPKKGKKR